ncbi:hypothetical protein SPRG_06163 [Saprolegnia parasitica CBS 223.65]|uniref:Autophagy-related protein 17 n=1 Tax=Saprolegnia parasitica (strain CBS 223.65) TaxID=695850 RepID=A0A067CQM7_SAPPC|nr:hypothetical protein SPRG_06163 [Saprolegnia parasitica CBS 223.65]KDO29107.1 hypothetical protein SPRG_06163 [Saprolegnia parasitica CBS 223.65]|eukprot:XP_012200273.1 hypothetical protein SPRG_06163 [Saprolegnia parasitica CBS 223.65]
MMSVSQCDVGIKRDGLALAELHEQALGLQGLLHEICTTMTMRIQAVASSVEASEAAVEAQRAATTEFLATHEPVILNINSIFDALQGQSVDPNMVGGEEGKTLFDFVDGDTVLQLQKDAAAHGTMLHALVAKHAMALDTIRSMLQFYHTIDFEILGDASSSFEAIAIPGGDVWATVSSHVGDLVARTAENIPQHRTLLDGSTAAQVSSSSLALVQASQDAVDRLSLLYDTALDHFVDMEQCDRKIVESFADMHDANVEYESLYSATRALYEELLTLHGFYAQFQASFDSLAIELGRRKAFAQQHLHAAREMQARLRAAEERELEARRAYASQHLRFLPAALAPLVEEAPWTTRLDVVRPNIPES